MENATKALLIAAAILIAILIISLSLVVYRMASEAIGNVNLSEAEMTQYNSKFTAFEGSKVSGAQVNALLTTVITHNGQATAEGTGRYVSVTVNDPTVSVVSSSTSISTKVPTSATYTVVCTLEKGLVKSIAVTKNT